MSGSRRPTECNCGGGGAPRDPVSCVAAGAQSSPGRVWSGDGSGPVTGLVRGESGPVMGAHRGLGEVWRCTQ